MFTYRVQMKGSSYRWDSRTSSDTCVSGGHSSSLSRSGVSRSCPQCDLGFFSKTPCLGWLSFVSLFLVGFFSTSCSTVYVIWASWLFTISTASFHLLPPTHYLKMILSHSPCMLSDTQMTSLLLTFLHVWFCLPREQASRRNDAVCNQ